MNAEVNHPNISVDFKVERVYPVLEDLEVTPTMEEQNFKSSKYGFNNITVKAIEGNTLEITPTLEAQNFTGVFDTVNVKGIEAEELNITPSTEEQTFTGLYNKVTVFGVEGTYEELSYIQGTGQQYFDTGITMATNLNIEIEYQLTEITGGQCLFGESVSGSHCYAAGYNGVADRFGINYGGSVDKVHFTNSLDYVTLKVTNDNVIYNDTIHTGTNVLENNGGTLWLLNNGKYKGEGLKGKLYSCKIYKNGSIIRYYIPVKDTEGTVCLYDIITKTFCYNAGSGNFISG